MRPQLGKKTQPKAPFKPLPTPNLLLYAKGRDPLPVLASTPSDVDSKTKNVGNVLDSTRPGIPLGFQLR